MLTRLFESESYKQNYFIQQWLDWNNSIFLIVKIYTCAVFGE
jgi:hypothetical protein